MFTAFFALFTNSSVWKFFGIIAILLGIAGTASYYTYNKTKTYYISQGDSRVLKIQTEEYALQKSFDDYRSVQADRLRALEVSSSTNAQAAARSIYVYRQKVREASTAYELLLSSRKEVAGNLSSAAVDTINNVEGKP